VRLPPTPSQTVGPFFSLGLGPRVIDKIAGQNVSGERVTIQGYVLDGDGQPVPDAMIEVWQANTHGEYARV
jgi:protocatechuate 3,4-dioxygenase alpha subunit